MDIHQPGITRLRIHYTALPFARVKWEGVMGNLLLMIVTACRATTEHH